MHARRIVSRSTAPKWLPLILLAGAAAAGDGPPVRVTRCDLDVALDPPAHMLRATATLTLMRISPADGAGAPLAVDFALNRALTVHELSGRGLTVRQHTPNAAPATQPAPGAGGEPLLSVHRVLLDMPGREAMLTFQYGGELIQDVQAGEKPGQIHNFLMAAHVGPEGLYLDAGGGWYPAIHRPSGTRVAGDLIEFRLAAMPVPDWRLVAGAQYDAAESEKSGRPTWRSKYPVDGLALVGGPHLVREKRVGDVQVAVHYSLAADEQTRATIEKHVDDFLAAATLYLERYPPLVGPYPFERFTIVENFFSSGFAFPEFTLLNKVLLKMGPRALMHGYLDHELLHSWWGNSIYVDPADGNWCEALASYGANYYGYVLDGDEKGARGQRRNYCATFSGLKPEEDQPLDTFGRPGGVGRDVGYGKGAMVFHMLARQIGQDAFWAAIRRLTDEYTGRYASWKTLQRLFEEEGGRKLDRFFEQWVRSAGAPQLALAEAVWQAAGGELTVRVKQSGPAFDVSVPLRIEYEDGADEQLVPLAAGEMTATWKLPRRPVAVALDPDFHVLRKLEPREIMPTARLTANAPRLLVVKPEGELSPLLARVVGLFRGEDESKDVLERTATTVTAADFAGRSVLVLGAAARSPVVAELLRRAACPVVAGDGWFRVDEAEHVFPAGSVLCTVHHPDATGQGVTVYLGNSEDALGRSDLLLFYRNSLVRFETTAREVDGEKTYEAKPVERRDFEDVQRVEVRDG